MGFTRKRRPKDARKKSGGVQKTGKAIAQIAQVLIKDCRASSRIKKQ
jgi:hypothetical protein